MLHVLKMAMKSFLPPLPASTTMYWPTSTPLTFLTSLVLLTCGFNIACLVFTPIPFNAADDLADLVCILCDVMGLMPWYAAARGVPLFAQTNTMCMFDTFNYTTAAHHDKAEDGHCRSDVIFLRR